jgi:hypothetical protein
MVAQDPQVPLHGALGESDGAESASEAASGAASAAWQPEDEDAGTAGAAAASAVGGQWQGLMAAAGAAASSNAAIAANAGRLREIPMTPIGYTPEKRKGRSRAPSCVRRR